MNLPILSALAFAGLGPMALCLSDESGTVQEPAKREKPAPAPDEAKTVWEFLSGRYDANGDGKIAKAEYTRGADQFARLDKDNSGFIDESDCKQASDRGARGGGGRGARGGERGARPAAAPTEGSATPDFELETLYPAKEAEASDKPAVDSKKARDDAARQANEPVAYETVKLSSLKGKKPVALIFGSYT